MFSSNISPPQSSPQNFCFALNYDTYYHDFLLHHYNLTPTTTTTIPPLIPLPPTITNQEIINLPNDQYGLVAARSKKKATTSKRKDRHCKIVTAQGLRDRRVRLSTGIAREFFDLQDLLGFDKASKTLEWLLNKSRTAINRLVQMKQMVTTHDIDDQEEEESLYFNNNFNNTCSTFCTTSSVKVFEKSAKGLRAKARARAKERTLEKYCIRKLTSTTTTTTSNQDDEVMKEEILMPISKPSQLLGSNCSTCQSELFCFCHLNHMFN